MTGRPPRGTCLRPPSQHTANHRYNRPAILAYEAEGTWSECAWQPPSAHIHGPVGEDSQPAFRESQIAIRKINGHYFNAPARGPSQILDKSTVSNLALLRSGHLLGAVVGLLAQQVAFETRRNLILGLKNGLSTDEFHQFF